MTRTDYDLPYSSEAPALARALVLAQCPALLGEGRDDLELLVSEIVTNAWRHGRPDVVLSVDLDADRIRVEVCDGGVADIPVVRDARAGGWGLNLVSMLSSAWGISSDHTGTRVWFSVWFSVPSGG